MDIIAPKPICLSGGAYGADLQWGMCAGTAGHDVIHFTFAGFSSQAPETEIVQLSKDQLERVDSKLISANNLLKRKIPKIEYTRNLLRRNYYQIEHSERVYAVSSIYAGVVSGGTGWAVAMYLLRHNMLPCEAYVFDQKKSMWFVWKGSWEEIETPPSPHGVYTGIGSRKLKDNGKNAIRGLLGYKK